MGILTGLRRASRRSRGVWIVLTVVLGIGLVGSYMAFSAPPTTPSNSLPSQEDAQKQAEALLAQAKQQVEATKKEIRGLEEELKASRDVNTLQKLADKQLFLGSLYLYPLSEQDKAKEAFEAAIENLQLILKLNPKAKGVHLKLAGAALQVNRQELADENFQQAVAADPKDIDARLSYGVFLAFYKKDYKQAIAQWEEVLTQKPPEDITNYVKSLIQQAKSAQLQTEKDKDK